MILASRSMMSLVNDAHLGSAWSPSSALCPVAVVAPTAAFPAVVFRPAGHHRPLSSAHTSFAPRSAPLLKESQGRTPR